MGPIHGTVDLAGNVYVVDAGNHRVQKFDSSGQFLLEFGSVGTGPGELLTPMGIALERVFDGRIFVLDPDNARVEIFDSAGVYQSEWGVSGSGPGAFDHPADIDIDWSSGDVFLVDEVLHRVQRYGADGTFVSQWGGFGSGPGQFSSPAGIAVFGEQLLVVVADTGNDRVQLFDLDGNWQADLGSTVPGPARLSGPRGVSFECSGNVLVADSGNDRIVEFDLAGNLLRSWGGSGSGTGQFNGPGDVMATLVEGIVTGLPRARRDLGAAKKALGGDLFVVDSGNDRIVAYGGPCCSGFFDASNVSASSAAGSILITPAGSGPTLASRGLTVTVQIDDSCGVPIAGFPFQDIWLDDIGNGDIQLCRGGSSADANSDANGQTTISGAIAGGGWTQSAMQVYLAGVAVGSPPLDIEVNSPDINGDLLVNLADVGDFAQDFHAGMAAFRSDFIRDDVLNLADIGELAVHLGESCP